MGKYRREHAFAVREHVIVPETENGKALSPEVIVSPLIVIAIGMLRAVRLDDQAALEANEIDDIWFDNDLAAKLESRQAPVAEHRP